MATIKYQINQWYMEMNDALYTMGSTQNVLNKNFYSKIQFKLQIKKKSENCANELSQTDKKIPTFNIVIF